MYFDENERDEHGGFDLIIPGSQHDIEAAGADLRDGLHVILYDNAEIEVEAVLRLDTRYRRWMGSPIWSTLKRSSDC
jgi:hypothetical protein